MGILQLLFSQSLEIKPKAFSISYQLCLQLLMQEEFLRKLSKSRREDMLILKGGLFIYTLIILKVEQQLMSISCSNENMKKCCKLFLKTIKEKNT